MKYTEEDLTRAKEIIIKFYPDKKIHPESLGILANYFSNVGIKENGKPIEPTRNAAKRIIDEIVCNLWD